MPDNIYLLGYVSPTSLMEFLTGQAESPVTQPKADKTEKQWRKEWKEGSPKNHANV